MNVTKIESRTVKTYTLTVEDGEIRDQPYSRSGRRCRVDRVVVTKRDGNGAVESMYRQGDWPEWLRSTVRGLA